MHLYLLYLSTMSVHFLVRVFAQAPSWAWRVEAVLLPQWEAKTLDAEESVPLLIYWTTQTESLCLI